MYCLYCVVLCIVCFVLFCVLFVLCCSMYCLFCVVLCIVCFVLFYVLFVLCRSVYCLFCVVLCIVCFMSFCVLFVLCCSVYFLFCVVLCIVCFVSFYVLFVCKCVLHYCHQVSPNYSKQIYLELKVPDRCQEARCMLGTTNMRRHFTKLSRPGFVGPVVTLFAVKHRYSSRMMWHVLESVVKVTLEQVIKALGGGRSIALLFLQPRR